MKLSRGQLDATIAPMQRTIARVLAKFVKIESLQLQDTTTYYTPRHPKSLILQDLKRGSDTDRVHTLAGFVFRGFVRQRNSSLSITGFSAGGVVFAARHGRLARTTAVSNLEFATSKHFF